MLIAHVAGISTMRKLHQFGTAEMVIASLAIQYADYRTFMIKNRTKRFRILDSGIFEVILGTSKTVVKTQDYLELARVLNVDEVVALDEPENPRGSMLRTCSFISKWKQYTDSPKPSMMLVPQGRSMAEWLRNADSLLTELPGSTIGIPRTLCDRCAPDEPFFRLHLAKTVMDDTRCRAVHLLGAGRHILEEVAAAAFMTRIVRSIDTTVLHRTALAKLRTLREYQAPVSLEGNTGSTEEDVVVMLNSELLTALSTQRQKFCKPKRCLSGGNNQL